MSYAVRRFWNRVADIREDETDRSQHRHYWQQQTQAIERALVEVIDEACSPWFDERSFH